MASSPPIYDAHTKGGANVGLVGRLLGKDLKPRSPFWRTPPAVSGDLAVLHQYGISAASRQDGAAMIASGWAIWRRAGIGNHQAFDLISDGVGLWRQSDGYDIEQDRLLIRDMLNELLEDQPGLPDDIWTAPRDLVEPAAAHYSAQCWAASELVDIGANDFEKRIAYDAIISAPEPFAPTRSIVWAKAHAASNGYPAPWT